jgi:HPt (histidine-containing phosphotransfer) domain-containing protein
MTDAIDRAHLAAQTFGDSALAREVLGLFREQADPLLQALAASSGAARADIAHRLKGSALAIGAFDLAAAAASLEAKPDDPFVLRAVEQGCADVMRAIGDFTAG